RRPHARHLELGLQPLVLDARDLDLLLGHADVEIGRVDRGVGRDGLEGGPRLAQRLLRLLLRRPRGADVLGARAGAQLVEPGLSAAQVLLAALNRLLDRGHVLGAGALRLQVQIGLGGLEVRRRLLERDRLGPPGRCGAPRLAAASLTSAWTLAVWATWRDSSMLEISICSRAVSMRHFRSPVSSSASRSPFLTGCITSALTERRRPACLK